MCRAIVKNVVQKGVDAAQGKGKDSKGTGEEDVVKARQEEEEELAPTTAVAQRA